MIIKCKEVKLLRAAGILGRGEEGWTRLELGGRRRRRKRRSTWGECEERDWINLSSLQQPAVSPDGSDISTAAK